MARPKIKNPIPKRHIGLMCEADLYNKFAELTRRSGITINFGIRRLIIYAVMTGEIPGIDRLMLDEKQGIRSPKLSDAPVRKGTTG